MRNLMMGERYFISTLRRPLHDRCQLLPTSPPKSILVEVSIKNLGIQAEFTLDVKDHCVRKVLVCLIRQGGG